MSLEQDYDLAVAEAQGGGSGPGPSRTGLEYTNAPAPISGRIGRELATVGALVGHGEATNLAVIEQIDPIYANFTEPGADEMRLKKEVASGKLKRNGSAAVELVLEDGSIYPDKGKLLFSDQVVDPEHRRHRHPCDLPQYLAMTCCPACSRPSGFPGRARITSSSCRSAQ